MIPDSLSVDITFISIAPVLEFSTCSILEISGEFLSIYGTVISNIGILKYYGFIAVIVILLSAFYVLKFLHECFYSWLPHKYNHVQDVAVHEFIVLGAISSIIILLGCFPFIIINFLNN